MVPGKPQQMSLFIEIHRLSVGGQPEQQTNQSVWQAACLLSGVNKQDTGGGPMCADSQSGDIACCGLPCQAGLSRTEKHRKAFVSVRNNNKSQDKFEVGGKSQPSDGIHLSGAVNTSALTALYLLETLP